MCQRWHGDLSRYAVRFVQRATLCRTRATSDAVVLRATSAVPLGYRWGTHAPVGAVTNAAVCMHR